ncbi:uncharacterized protein LOC123407509 [Hordeum vulgare subsp. vulgare]|uniref:Uncharacterized protein n=1 Tax=Hordeum vulgare subsp. vulgare TaxID=112509 RepID=A0A8I6YC55_HORVV|nr:uncharacterized protein LOC123407509 [Hordeum vulgare subsp. vulgare]
MCPRVGRIVDISRGSNGPSTQRLLHRAVAAFRSLSCGPIRDTEAIERGRRFGRVGGDAGESGRGEAASRRGGSRRALDMVPAKGWSRRVGSARSFVGNALGGVRGWTNVASWAVAGTLAYYLWVQPARQLQKEQQERAALAAASDPYRYVEKRKPIPDPQDTGLTYGKKKDPPKSDN